jgi:hypothetical protein
MRWRGGPEQPRRAADEGTQHTEKNASRAGGLPAYPAKHSSSSGFLPEAAGHVQEIELRASEVRHQA